jgi:hypothetical protein
VYDHSGGSGARGGGVGKGSEKGRDRRRGGSSLGRSSSGRPTNDECWCCSKLGHWVCECRSKPKTEQAHFAQDEEEASLMLTMETLIHLSAR